MKALGHSLLLCIFALPAFAAEEAVPVEEISLGPKNNTHVIEISYWLGEYPGFTKALSIIADRYHKDHPDVSFILHQVSYPGYRTWANTQLIGDTASDLMQLHTVWAHEYGSQQGFLIPLRNYLEQENSHAGCLWRDLFTPRFLLSGRDPTYQENWTIPFGTVSLRFYYNKTIFAEQGLEVPQNWDELLAVCRKLKAAGIHPMSVANIPVEWEAGWTRALINKMVQDSLISELDTFDWEDTVNAYEIAVAYEQKRLDLEHPRVITPLKMVKEMSEFWAPGFNSRDERGARDLFVNGQAAMWFHGSWLYNGLKDLVGGRFEIGVFPLPFLTKETTLLYDGPYLEFHGSAGLEFAVTRKCQKKGNLDTAIDFLRYMTAPQNAQVYTEAAAVIPIIYGVEPTEEVRPFVPWERGTHDFGMDPLIVNTPNFANEAQREWHKRAQLFYDGTVSYEKFIGDYREFHTSANHEALRKSVTGLRRTRHDIISDLLEAEAQLLHEMDAVKQKDIRHRLLEDTGASLRANLETERYLAPVVFTPEEIAMLCHPAHPDLAVTRWAKRSLPLAGGVLLLIGIVYIIATGTYRRMLKASHLYLYLLPAFILLILFSYWPALSALFHAFFDWDGATREEWIGLQNFIRMAHDRDLIKSCGVMTVFLIANLIKIIPTILLAILMYHLVSDRLRYGFRVAFVLPLAIPFIVGVLMWKFYYDYQLGLFNRLLDWIAPGSGIDWLGDRRYALPSLILMGFPWLNSIGVLIFLAGLENISRDVYDAASVDGIGPMRRIFAIELPLLMGQIKLNVVLTIIGTVQDFGFIQIMTNGGPAGATLVPALHMYHKAFDDSEYGYASAIGVAMFLLILGLTWLNTRYMKSRTA